MTPNVTSASDNTRIKLEIPVEKISSLMQSGLLHFADCRCLDQVAKQQIWQILLNTSVTR